MQKPVSLSRNLSIALLLCGVGLAAIAFASHAESVQFSPSDDPDAYAPGEAVTITINAMSTTLADDFEIQLENGTIVMAAYNISSATGTYAWSIVIPTDWDGWYYVVVYRNLTRAYRTDNDFYVELFTLTAEANHFVYLPGEDVTVFFFTQRTDNQQPLGAGNGRWRVQIQRDSGSGIVTETLSQPFTNAYGSFSFNLPASTQRNYYTIYVTYNDTTDKHSRVDTVSIQVGSFNLDASTDRSVYQAGESVVVTVTANTVYGNSEPTSGVSVASKVEVYDTGNASWSTDATYVIAAQTTNQEGRVSFIIALHSPIPDDTLMRVYVTATRSGATQEDSQSFTIRASTGLNVDLKLDKTEYRAGETIVARLVFTSTNASLITGSMYHWRVTNQDTNAVISEDYVAGTATGSEKSIVIPSDYIGSIDIEVTVYTPDDREFYDDDTATVFSYALLLNPAKLAYKPGDSVDIRATLVTGVACSGGATFLYTVSPGSGGDPLTKGSLTPGGMEAHIVFAIPADPDDRYAVAVAASCGGLVVQDSVSVFREKYVSLQIDIPDKSYKPGDTVKIHYKFTPIGGATMPATATISVYLYGGTGGLPGSGGYSVGNRYYEVSLTASGEGDLDFVIPSTAPADGDLLLIASGGGSGSASSTVFMRASGGASPASAAANTANWGLIVAVLALFVGVLAMMRRPKNPMGSEGDSSRSSSSYSDMKSESPKKDPEVEKKDGDSPKSL